MAKKYICNIKLDRKSAKEGEYVTVTWECENPDGVTLTIDNGYSINTVQLADSGSKSFQVSKSKKKTVFKLNAVFGGKIQHKEVSLKVDNFKPKKQKAAKGPTAAGSYSHKSSGINGPKAWFGSISNWFKNIPVRWNTFWQRFKYGWSMLPAKKQRIYKIVFAILIAMWLISLGQRSGYKAGYEKGLKEGIRTEHAMLYKG